MKGIFMSKNLFSIMILALMAYINAMGFDSFWKEFKRTGCGSNAFNSGKVKDWPTFWKEWRSTGNGSSAFNSNNVRDFKSFYKEFLGTYSHTAAFNPRNVKI